MLHMWLACPFCSCFHLSLWEDKNLLNRNGPKSSLFVQNRETSFGTDGLFSECTLHSSVTCIGYCCVCGLPFLSQSPNVHREKGVLRLSRVIAAVLPAGSQSTCLMTNARIFFYSCFQNLLFQNNFWKNWVKIIRLQSLIAFSFWETLFYLL